MGPRVLPLFLLCDIDHHRIRGHGSQQVFCGGHQFRFFWIREGKMPNYGQMKAVNKEILMNLLTGDVCDPVLHLRDDPNLNVHQSHVGATDGQGQLGCHGAGDGRKRA